MVSFIVVEKRLKKYIGNRAYVDERIVKPGSFIYSEFVRNVFKEHPLYYTKRKQRRVRGLNARLMLDRPIKMTPKRRRLAAMFGYREDETHYDAEFFPVTPEDRILTHTTVFFNNGSLVDPEKPIPTLDQQVKSGVVGNPDENRQTYLRSPRMSRSARDCCILSSGEYTTELEIDVETLLKYRTIFHDPEGTVCRGEYRKTFVVFGGIPTQAIVGFKMYDD
ncbi:MAG TPA: hypothetical protein VJA47_00405 [archaeon]|nr:hypothetical protein [archaeon]